MKLQVLNYATAIKSHFRPPFEVLALFCMHIHTHAFQMLCIYFLRCDKRRSANAKKHALSHTHTDTMNLLMWFTICLLNFAWNWVKFTRSTHERKEKKSNKNSLHTNSLYAHRTFNSIKISVFFHTSLAMYSSIYGALKIMLKFFCCCFAS